MPTRMVALDFGSDSRKKSAVWKDGFGRIFRGKINLMAEITEHGGGNDVKVRAKKRSTRIDMTPMVDLAFLLLTFFILTTSFKKPYVLQLDMPEKVVDPGLLPRKHEKDILNLMLGKDDKILWWIGLTPPVHETDYSKDGIRRVLLEKRTNPELMVLIKAADDARFQNMVDILDEMQITEIGRYAIVELEDEDKKLVRRSRSEAAARKQPEN